MSNKESVPRKADILNFSINEVEGLRWHDNSRAAVFVLRVRMGNVRSARDGSNPSPSHQQFPAHMRHSANQAVIGASVFSNVSVRHKRMVPSSPPDANALPSGVKRTPYTGPW
mmetsp:Transcript_18102/g.30233  ORF Transcript_18102/g.30233 Transcript_18102/m.30233 type:complete len:113 (+) Transcript_18102:64-402(+)